MGLDMHGYQQQWQYRRNLIEYILEPRPSRNPLLPPRPPSQISVADTLSAYPGLEVFGFQSTQRRRERDERIAAGDDRVSSVRPRQIGGDVQYGSSAAPPNTHAIAAAQTGPDLASVQRVNRTSLDADQTERRTQAIDRLRLANLNVTTTGLNSAVQPDQPAYTPQASPGSPIQGNAPIPREQLIGQQDPFRPELNVQVPLTPRPRSPPHRPQSPLLQHLAPTERHHIGTPPRSKICVQCIYRPSACRRSRSLQEHSDSKPRGSVLHMPTALCLRRSSSTIEMQTPRTQLVYVRLVYTDTRPDMSSMPDRTCSHSRCSVLT